MTTIKIKTSSYNQRRYGKPWIAKVVGKEFQWGDWYGASGEEGELSLDCEPGDLVAKGQKDFRKSRNSAPDYGFIDVDGYAQWGYTKVAARDLAAEAKNAEPQMSWPPVG